MENKKLIDALLECAITCEWCANECLDEEKLEMLIDCIRTDKDCASICFTGAELLARSSEYSGEMIKLCETACRECAEECEKHEHEHCRICAEACRRCEEACKEFATA